jgi:ABC-type amino acid transport substrate-binding protein
MLTRSASVLAILLLMFGCGSAQSSGAASAADAPPRTLDLATTPWAPFTGSDEQPRVAVDLVQAVLERAGYRVKTSVVPDGDLTTSLEHKDYDGSPAMWLTADREQFLLFSKPYLENRMVLVGKKGSDVSATSFAALSGKRIGLVQGYAYGKEVDSAREPLFIRGATEQENLRALLAGTIDYLLLDELLVNYLFERSPADATARLEVGQMPLVKRTLHLAVQRSLPDAKAIIDKFDALVAEMIKSGAYHKALQVTWIEADVDGDGRRELVPSGHNVGTAPPERGYQVFTPATPLTATPRTGHGNQRYMIDGRIYESWSDIPNEHKLQPQYNDPGGGRPAMRLLDW